MIKTTELRLGNLVYAPNLKGDVEIARIYSITTADVMVQGAEKSHSVGMESLEPIPITEERLSRLGFQYDPKIDGHYYLPLPNFHGLTFGRTELTKAYLYDRFIECPHLHQLQNLIFALTGEELTIKETL